MAFGPKHNPMLSDAPVIKTSRFQPPSLASTSPVLPFTSSSASGSAYISSKRRILPYRNEHGRINVWLDAMKASSPPHTRSTKGDPFDKSSNEVLDIQYGAWIAKHPSALAMFDQIFEAAKEKQVAVFLDYDGTLSPIVEDPDSAFMSEAMRDAVKEVASHFPTAIISGRCRDKVYEFVQLAELYYAGSHGMDIMGPVDGCNGVNAHGIRAVDTKGNEVVLFQPPTDFTHIIDEVCKILVEKAKHVQGAKVENNKFCASVHFRCVKEEDWAILAKHVQTVIQSYPNLSLTQGRKVLEIRPSIQWDKGKALEFLLKTLGLGNCNDAFPVYIGDDTTDEDAFKVLNEGHGLSVIVSSAAKETNAICSLRDPHEVVLE
eukprot:c25491_g1_i2 orf=1239-2363(+)